MPTLILPSGRVDGHLAQRGHETTGLATRGTDGSNPPPSSGESPANLTCIHQHLPDLARHRSAFRLNAWADLAEACQDARNFRLSRQR
jgi:hypothetical protein